MSRFTHEALGRARRPHAVGRGLRGCRACGPRTRDRGGRLRGERDQGPGRPGSRSVEHRRLRQAARLRGLRHRRYPSEGADGSTRRERIDNRDDLALPSELSRRLAATTGVRKFAERECATSLQLATGYDELKLRDVGAEDARSCRPSAGSTPLLLRDAGAGMARWTPRYGVQRPVRECPSTPVPAHPAHAEASPDDRMLLTKLGGASLPVEFRQCRAYDKKRRAVAASPAMCHTSTKPCSPSRPTPCSARSS